MASHIAFNISFVSVVVREPASPAWTPRLEEAAMDLYANAVADIPLTSPFPQILPGIAGGALLALTLSLDDVVDHPVRHSGPGATTLPVFVFSLIRKWRDPD